jgi:hypothetical protein
LVRRTRSRAPDTAPSICRINFDVGPSSRKDDGLSAAINDTAGGEIASFRKGRGEADFLSHEIAGKTVRRLDDNRPNAIASDAGKAGIRYYPVI